MRGFAGVDMEQFDCCRRRIYALSEKSRLPITGNIKASNRIKNQTMTKEDTHMSNEDMNQGKWKEHSEHRQSPRLEERQVFEQDQQLHPRQV